jgi:hypothetical protein
MLVAYKLTDNRYLERNKDSLSIQYIIYLTNILIHFCRCTQNKIPLSFLSRRKLYSCDKSRFFSRIYYNETKDNLQFKMGNHVYILSNRASNYVVDRCIFISRLFYLFYFDRQERNSEHRKNIFIHVSFLFTVTSIKVIFLKRENNSSIVCLDICHIMMIVWSIVNTFMYKC